MGDLKKERFVLRGGTLRFIFSERFVLRIILCNHLLFCIKIDNAFTGRQFFTLSKHCPFFFWHIQPVCLCDAYKTPAFSLLRCNSRALLVISILFSG